MEYFKNFPYTEFSDNQCVNIMVRSKIKDYIKKNIFLYNDYYVEDYERADIIANTYYGNYKYTWLIFYANDIFDPIRDWFLSYSEFQSYLNFKYQETPWKPSTVYFVGNKVLYGSIAYNCIEQHISDSPIVGYYVSSNQFNRETQTWELNYLQNDYAFFYNILDRANGVWLQITNNDGVTLTVDGTLPSGCNRVEMYTPDKWTLLNGTGEPRPGFEVAHQTIHEFRDSHNLVVDFDSWYDDVFEDVINEMGYEQLTFKDLDRPSTLSPRRQYVQMIDQNENYYFIEMKFEYDYTEGKWYPSYFTTEDITTYLNKTQKQDGLVQDFTVRTKNVNDPPEWVKAGCVLDENVGWVDNSDPDNPIVVVPNTYSGKRTITKYQYEMDLNEKKRKIKLIDSRYVAQILQEFKQILKSY